MGRDRVETTGDIEPLRTLGGEVEGEVLRFEGGVLITHRVVLVESGEHRGALGGFFMREEVLGERVLPDVGEEVCLALKRPSVEEVEPVIAPVFGEEPSVQVAKVPAGAREVGMA